MKKKYDKRFKKLKDFKLEMGYLKSRIFSRSRVSRTRKDLELREFEILRYFCKSKLSKPEVNAILQNLD